MRHIAMLFALVACANDADVGSSAQSVVGGYFDQSVGPTVALFRCSGACVFDPYLNPAEICSGTLIGPNLVLTARHCVAPTNEVGTSIACSTTTFGTPYDADNFIVTPADSVLAGGPWFIAREVDVTGQDNDSICGNDVAVLHLRESYTGAVPMVPRIAEPPVLHELYSAIGYGDDLDGGLGYRHRRDGLAVACVGTQCKTLGADLMPLVAPAEFGGQTGLCGGDSGGPAVDTNGLLIGVTSRGTTTCDMPVYSRVDSHAAWLQAQAVAAASYGGYALPAWAYAPLPSDSGADASPSMDAAPEDEAATPVEASIANPGEAAGGCNVGSSSSGDALLIISLLMLFMSSKADNGRRHDHGKRPT